MKTGTTLLPRFDPFPNALPPTHQPILKQKKSRKNNKEKSHDDTDEDQQQHDNTMGSSMISDILTTTSGSPYNGTNRPSSSSSYRRRLNLNTIKTQKETVMYVDLQKLKLEMEIISFPLYGVNPIHKNLIEQLLYCSQIQDYSQKLVNEYSGQFVKLMSCLFLTFGGGSKANDSALSIGKSLLQLCKINGFQSVLVENDSILPACIGIVEKINGKFQEVKKCHLDIDVNFAIDL